jgi:hypothetical protein
MKLKLYPSSLPLSMESPGHPEVDSWRGSKSDYLPIKDNLHIAFSVLQMPEWSGSGNAEQLKPILLS